VGDALRILRCARVIALAECISLLLIHKVWLAGFTTYRGN
jgi:hypothetical protein